jgi:hypothetical protein
MPTSMTQKMPNSIPQRITNQKLNQKLKGTPHNPLLEIPNHTP